MDILFTICGRAGSKGIKNKNVRDFLDKPLCLYSLSAIDLYLKYNPEVSADIVVSTDSEKLIEIMENNRMRKVDIIHRCEMLSGDRVAKSEVILDCLKKMREEHNKHYEMVVDLDITSPLRKVADMERLIQKKKEIECDVVFSVVPAKRSPYFNMVKKDANGYTRVIDSEFISRQQAPEVYDMNGSLYAYSPGFLERTNGCLEGRCEIIEMQDTGILDLDHERDFELMQVVAKYLYESDEKYSEIRKNIENGDQL